MFIIIMINALQWIVAMQDTGLHYDHYLREVIDFLEKDEHFREKLRNTDMDDIKVLSFVFFSSNNLISYIYAS